MPAALQAAKQNNGAPAPKEGRASSAKKATTFPGRPALKSESMPSHHGGAHPLKRILVEWLGNTRQFPEWARKQARVVVAGCQHDRDIAADELRQDVEHLPSAQIDVEHRAIQRLRLEGEQDVVELGQGSHHLAAECLQHGFHVECDQPFIFGEKNPAMGETMVGRIH
jgi:hypothetical protein